jgi:hypothetical protein
MDSLAKQLSLSYASYHPRKPGPSSLFPHEYTQLLRSLSRKHKDDDADEVKRSLHTLHALSRESRVHGRGDIWIPEPDARTGYYPILEDIPHRHVRTAIRGNTSDEMRRRAWGKVAESSKRFQPLFASEPGGLDPAQKRSFLAHAMVAFPYVKGRTPALLGNKVPGELDMMKVGMSKSDQMNPEDWGGMQVRRYALRRLQYASQLAMGTKIEMEHTNNPRVAQQIAKDHLAEFDDYYTRLKKMEAEAKREKSVKEYTLFYEMGEQTWATRKKESARDAWRWLKGHLLGSILPAAVEGATHGGLSFIHQTTGAFPGTEVNLRPLTTHSFKKDFSNLSDWDLRNLQSRLAANQAVTSLPPHVSEALNKRMGDIHAELVSRGAA